MVSFIPSSLHPNDAAAFAAGKRDASSRQGKYTSQIMESIQTLTQAMAVLSSSGNIDKSGHLDGGRSFTIAVGDPTRSIVILFVALAVSASDCIPRQCPKVYSCMKAKTLGTPLSMKRPNQTQRKASYLVRCGTILWGSFASLRLRRSGLPLAVSYHPQLSPTVPAATVLTRTQMLQL